MSLGMNWNDLLKEIAVMSEEQRQRPIVVDCDYEMLIAKTVYVDEEGNLILETADPNYGK